MTTLTRQRPLVLEGGPLNNAGAEGVYARVKTPTDPTAGAAPEFTLTTGTSSDLSSAVWSAGQWVADSWEARPRTSWVQTPTIGGAGTLETDVDTNYNLWCKIGDAIVYLGVVPVE